MLPYYKTFATLAIKACLIVFSWCLALLICTRLICQLHHRTYATCVKKSVWLLNDITEILTPDSLSQIKVLMMMINLGDTWIILSSVAVRTATGFIPMAQCLVVPDAIHFIFWQNTNSKVPYLVNEGEAWPTIWWCKKTNAKRNSRWTEKVCYLSNVFSNTFEKNALTTQLDRF